MDIKGEIQRKVAAIAQHVSDNRRYLHQNPELSLKEYKTAAWVAGRLKELGLQPTMLVGGRGVTAVIEGAKTGKTVALRADMDALPIEEATGAAYKSTSPGVMHACGHDGHTANLLGVAEVLLALKPAIAGRVKLVFQPAEEEHGGAALMIKDGVLEGPHVDAIFALHGWSNLPVGSMAFRNGPTMAASDRFEITVTGKGGHAAYPHLGLNPISALSRLVNDLETIPATRIPACEAAVVSVANFHAGQGMYNVIPNAGKISGTYRTLKADIRTQVGVEIRKRCEALKALGFEVKADLQQGYPVTYNTAGLEPVVRQAIAAQLGEAAMVEHPEASMGAEDFAFYGEKIPAYYMRLGLGDRPNLHNPAFDFNDAALPVGMAAMARIAIEYLNG